MQLHTHNQTCAIRKSELYVMSGEPSSVSNLELHVVTPQPLSKKIHPKQHDPQKCKAAMLTAQTPVPAQSKRIQWQCQQSDIEQSLPGTETATQRVPSAGEFGRHWQPCEYNHT
mmetsp:Transcript_46321/g.94731  ORF Transcript_46321/g.94731 Transcript_46321/m.94731 type:complete len:114 (+) Transcript_46321:457-798(+)